jgi:hypothetical protein
VHHDLKLAIENISDDGLIVMDDSSLYFDLPETFSGFRGHPGPSKVASEIDNNQLILVTGVGHNNIFKKAK